MNKYYSFKPLEIKNIKERFGTEFYEKVQKDIECYGEQLDMTSVELIPSYSANLVFKCHSKEFGNAVLKIGNTTFKEVATEIKALAEYNGKGFCKVFAADPGKGVIVEECILPGSTLRQEKSIDKRLEIFASLYQDLHITSKHVEAYPTYVGWVSRITDYMSTRQDWAAFYSHMKKAKDICMDVASSYTRQMLLHGDFHHDNILLGSDGNYTIIDPKGVIGDPVFDIPRFILNEFDEEITEYTYEKISHVINVLEKRLSIPAEVIKKCLYVETAMAMCWDIEDGATPEEFDKLEKTIRLAEAILYS